MATKAQKAVTQAGHEDTETRRRISFSKDNPLQPILQNRHVEVHQQAHAQIGYSQIAQKLRAVNGIEPLDGDIEVALERWREARQIEHDLAQTQETLETRKIVERAKGVLMDSQNLKETEAFRRIQRLSMNSRKSMREVAEAILLAHEAGRSL